MPPRTPKPRHLGLVALCAVAGVLLAGCGGEDESLSVAAAAPPLELLVREIGAGNVTVKPLTPAGGQPHGLAVSEPARAALRGADAVLYLSGGFQPQLQAEIDRLPEDTARLDLIGPAPLPPPTSIDGISGPGHATTDGAIDPHVWLDPVRYGEMATRTARLLGELDEPGREQYAARAEQIAREARQLDAEHRAALAGCRGRSFLTNHAAWGYLAERYGLRQVLVGGITAAARPPAASLRAVVRVAREQQASVLVTSIPLPRRIASVVERETGVTQIAALNPLEVLGGDPAATDYAAVSRSNLAALAGALGCGESRGAVAGTSPPPAAR